MQTRQDFQSMFGHFSTLCMKGLTGHYLDPAFIPVKSQCKMAECSIRVKNGFIHANGVS